MLETGLLISLFIIFVLIICSAFFSGSETGLTAIARARVYRLQKDGNKRAGMVLKLRSRKEALIGTILLGNNLVNIAASALATSVAIKIWGENGVIYVTLIMTALVLIFAEVMPKTFAINNPEKVALAVAPAFIWLVKVFAPITAAVQSIINSTLRLFGVDIMPGAFLISAADALRGTIELQHKEGEIFKLDRDMLGGILDLADTDVGEVMVHRKHIITIEATLSVSEMMRLAIESGHSRFPLWKDEADNIIGILHMRDLMRLIHEKGMDNVTHEEVEEALVKPWYVPETTSLRDQLLAFRRMRQHFALVVDEYGALLGIVTLEDILEEIVGEIDDEHDIPESGEIAQQKDGSYTVEGSVTIRDLNRHLDWSLPGEDANTIAGLVIHEARLIPDVGQIFEFHGCHFTILAKQGNQLTRLRVEPMIDTFNEDEDDYA
jgi:Mg2+/Co2+ transporter CorB